MASQITGVTCVYSTVWSGADQRKHQSSASLAFVTGIHRWPLNYPHKLPITRKMFPFDYIMYFAFDMILNQNIRIVFHAIACDEEPIGFKLSMCFHNWCWNGNTTRYTILLIHTIDNLSDKSCTWDRTIALGQYPLHGPIYQSIWIMFCKCSYRKVGIMWL